MLVLNLSIDSTTLVSSSSRILIAADLLHLIISTFNEWVEYRDLREIEFSDITLILNLLKIFVTLRFTMSVEKCTNSAHKTNITLLNKLQGIKIVIPKSTS